MAGLFEWGVVAEPVAAWLAWKVWGASWWWPEVIWAWILGCKAAGVLVSGWEYEEMDWKPSIVRLALLSVRRALFFVWLVVLSIG